MAVDFPIGINLGRIHITSAYINDKSEDTTITSIEASQEWKTFFLYSLQTKQSIDEQKNNADEVEGKVVASILTQIHLATQKKLGRPIGIYAIAYPQHFQHKRHYITPLLDTATELLPGFNNYLQMGPYLYYIKFAYQLHTSKAFRYPPGTKLNDVNALLVHIDYNKQSLEVSSMEAAEDICVRARLFRRDDFGGPDNTASSEDLADFKIHFEQLLDEQIRDNYEYQTVPDDFRFVIFSGEASLDEFQKLREVIVAVVPEFSNRFLDSVDPFWAGAMGAAYRAKEFFLDPPGVRKPVSTADMLAKLQQDQKDELCWCEKEE